MFGAAEAPCDLNAGLVFVHDPVGNARRPNLWEARVVMLDLDHGRRFGGRDGSGRCTFDPPSHD